MLLLLWLFLKEISILLISAIASSYFTNELSILLNELLWLLSFDILKADFFLKTLNPLLLLLLLLFGLFLKLKLLARLWETANLEHDDALLRLRFYCNVSNKSHELMFLLGYVVLILIALFLDEFKLLHRKAKSDNQSDVWCCFI